MTFPIAIFAIAQTLLYACFYYIFPATLLEWEAMTSWNRIDITLAFTLSIAISGLCSPIAGHFIDKGKGPIVIAAGVMLGGCLLWCLQYDLSLTQFYLIWIGIGIAMSSCLYEPIFAYIIKYRGQKAKADITTITLVAGFASTLCFPTVRYLLTHYTLSHVMMVAAVLVIGLVLPFYCACRQLKNQSVETWEHHSTAQFSERKPSALSLINNRIFLLLAVSFALLGLAHTVVISHLLPLLDERELTLQSATLIASLIGPMQVFGRIVSIFADKVLNLVNLTLSCFIGINLALIALYFAGDNLALLVIFVMFQGGSYGVISIMKPLVIKHFMGKSNMGVISGMLALPYLLCSAIAPYLGSIIWQTGSYYAVILCMLLFSAIALACFTVLTGLSKRMDNDEATDHLDLVQKS
ncbi:MFS transporter [Vibrio hippocampi]|uniref:MFS transporter n=1 Tax=Vibrio hippocampi TaxID=654686 RepID=A0ABN8DJB3_9VIBR|nr:MFS transporter [Vibrio hippocampi]CAH0525934.1 hypothetical protein VHP8226_01416 [Vibrio hippocampi]